MKQVPRISVCLVSWNGWDDLDRCLSSVETQTLAPFEVLLSDNDSKDDTPKRVREHYPWVLLEALEENVGFAEGTNRAATRATGDWLFVVNTDTEWASNLIEVLIQATETYRNYPIISCQMRSMADRHTIDCKGMRFLPSLRGQMVGPGQMVDPNEEPYPIFGATGGAMLVRKDVVDEIGLYDSAFFFNNEDVDFALRALSAGYRTLYLPQAVVYHRRSPNEARIPEKVLYYIQRNMELAVFKNIPWPVWLALGPLHLAYNGYQLGKWSARGMGGVVLKAKVDAIKMMPKLARNPISTKKLLKSLGRFRLKD